MMWSRGKQSSLQVPAFVVRRHIAGLLFWMALAVTCGDTDAQTRRGRQVPVPPPAAPAVKEAPTKGEEPKPAEPLEIVQADVSTRNVAVTSSFTGTEIVVFGAIENSRQPSPESGYYDVVIVIEGSPGRIVSRRKARVGGIWVNTTFANFDDVPSYYAISSTRPLEDVAPEAVLIGYEIGLNQVRMTPAGGSQERFPAAELKDFRSSIVRLKKKDGLYVQDDYGVAFIGRSLFRATIALPANVTVGPFETRVYLFRNDKLLSQYAIKLNLEREGVERVLHEFAFNSPFFYGMMTVSLALAAGLTASALFRRDGR
jgi:uncharacterized protein (TIGR02186 family)